MPTRSLARRYASLCRRIGFATALALCATAAVSTSAHAASLLVPAGSGMTMPAGIAVTTSGSIWISDQALGICRVQPGDPVLLVQSPYCRAEAEAGSLRPGPTTGHQIAFDPVSKNFFVAEGDSKGAGVWRMHWDQASDTIDVAQRIVNTNGNRVLALALGVGAAGVYVDFNGRDDATIRRLENAAGALPGTATTAVGAARAPGVMSMANLDGALYLAEAGGVSRIAAPGSGVPSAELVPGFPRGAGSVPSALAGDPARGRVYAGTGNVDGIDRVDVLTTADGAVTTYETGFALVTGITVRSSDGSLLVADDPPTSAGAPESVGQSRLWELALHDTNRPTVTITGGPAVYSNATTVTFSFSSSAGASFSCRLDGAPWSPCTTSATQTYTGLTDAVHVFEVRAADDGRAARQTFVVDTVAPTVSVDNPSSDRVIDQDSLRIRFSADEYGVSYRCELDGQPLHDCDPPVWLSGFALGEHTFTVKGTDLAGNSGAVRPWTFTRVPPPAAAQDSSGAGSPSSGTGTGPAPVLPPAPGPAAPTSGSSENCPAVRSTRQGYYSVRRNSHGRVLKAHISPPARARYAKLMLRPRNRAKGPGIALTWRTVSPNKTRSVRVRLTRVQAARLRSGRLLLTIAYGTCAGKVDAGTQLTSSKPKRRTR